MNKKVVICPACGSQQVSCSENENFGQLTLGPKFSFKEINYKCESCGEEGDFLAETDKNYFASQKEAQSNFVKHILENMNNAGITMAMFERVFELPARTLTRWKNGDFSSSALSLLRIVATYPWIIEVAENKFEKNFSRCAVITAAAQEFKNGKNQVDNTATYQLQKPISGSSTAFFVVRFDSSQSKLQKTIVTTGA